MTGDTALSQLLGLARTRLESAGISDAAGDARALLCGLLGLSLTDIVLHGNRLIAQQQVETVLAAIARRAAHEPVHRILGRREFHGLDLMLSADTLEPRPDTEILVTAMVPHVNEAVRRNGSARILDLGTGTGAICLALLDACPAATGVGSDIAEGALATAAENARALGLGERFVAQKSNWFSAINGAFDIIVSNPPYIRSSVIAELAPEVRRFDPMAALDGGDDGLDAYRAIAGNAGQFIKEGGKIGVETGFDQREDVTGIFEAEGFVTIAAIKDYGGNDRVLVFGVADDATSGRF